MLSAESEDTFLSRTNDLGEAPDPFPDARSADEFPESKFMNSIGMEFIRIPAGEFVMGIPDAGSGPAPPECRPHRVKIAKSFFMGRYEVTQKHFLEVVGRNPSYHTREVAGVDNTDSFPVENLTWSDAKEFCERLSAKPDEKAAGRRYRLPTEAEWEYVCRAGSEKAHKLPDRQAAITLGEAAGVSPLPVTDVGRFLPNAFGVYDMRGNVWEWCADAFSRKYYLNSPNNDPKGPHLNAYLATVRGADWIFAGEPCRINYSPMQPAGRNHYVGMRALCVIVPEANR